MQKFGGVNDTEPKSTFQNVKDSIVGTVNAGIEKIKHIGQKAPEGQKVMSGSRKDVRFEDRPEKQKEAFKKTQEIIK